MSRRYQVFGGIVASLGGSTGARMNATLYLSDTDVRALAITPAVTIDLVARAFRARLAGEIINPAKQHLAFSDQPVFFQTLSCVCAHGYACVKWIGVSAHAKANGVNTMLCLSDAVTAKPLAVMDANWITAMRTAAVSLLGARWIRSGVEKGAVGILGTGTQAFSHLEIFAAGLDVARFVVWGRNQAHANRLCEAAHARGYRAEVAPSHEALLRACNVVISALSADTTADSVDFDANELRPDAYLSLVDLGRPWRRSALARVALYTDDEELTISLMRSGSLPAERRIVDDLVTLSGAQTNTHAGDYPGPYGLLHPGVGYADLAMAAHVFEKACEAGCGTPLPT